VPLGRIRRRREIRSVVVTDAKQPRPCRRNWFKSKLLLSVGSLLVLTIFTPLHCQAQAEIDPDHYDITNDEPPPQINDSVTANRNAAGFHGDFTPAVRSLGK
jgi:hypothetical protein